MSIVLHPSAIVAPTAHLGANTTVGPYAVIEDGVTVGDGAVISAHAILRKGTTIGGNVAIDAFAVVGGDPQHLTFDRTTPTGVRIGDNVTIREHVTIHRSAHEGQATVIEDGVLLMATAHVGHDSRVGKGSILANQVLLGGHVEVGPQVFLGGGAAAHQHCRIGESVIASGLMQIAHDIPPFLMAAGRDEAHGLNLIGLKRRGVAADTISELRRLYREVMLAGGNLRRNAAACSAESGEGKRFLAFFAAGTRGFIRSTNEGGTGE